MTSVISKLVFFRIDLSTLIWPETCCKQSPVAITLGPQKGDLHGPLLFCNTIHPLLTSLYSVLCLAYMDDVTLGGPQVAVARVLAVSPCLR